MHARLRAFVAMNGIELLRRSVWQAALVIAHKRHAQSSRQDAFVGGHPLHAEPGGDGENFFGDAAFRWPHSLRTKAENFLVQIKAALKLFARVFRMAKTILRQRQTWGGNGPGVGIADER